MNASNAWAPLLARMMFTAVYMPSGIGKLLAFEATTGFIASRGLPMAGAIAFGAIALELLGSASLLLGWFTRWSALALLLFTLMAAMLFHEFWAAEPTQVMAQRQAFLKNLGIAGGLLLLATVGAGRLSLDDRLPPANKPQP